MRNGLELNLINQKERTAPDNVLEPKVRDLKVRYLGESSLTMRENAYEDEAEPRSLKALCLAVLSAW